MSFPTGKRALQVLAERVLCFYRYKLCDLEKSTTETMKQVSSTGQLVQVANQKFRWHIHRQPQWCTADGWKGLALYVELARDPQRILIIEFPFKILNHRNEPNKQRPKVIEKDVIHAISAALEAGYDPESRGKRFVFQMAETDE